jgi:outer membrane lipoprotein carrier protein
MVFLLASTAPADTMPLEQLTSKMQSTYENTQDFKANFTQELVIKSIGKTEREEGTVYFKNPGKMLWDYVKPKAKKLVINPQKASLYVPADRAVYVQDSANIYKSKVIIRFLSGIGKLGDDFEIKYSEPEAVDKEGRYLLTLVPKSPDLGVEKLFLVIEPASFRILQCSFTDSFGNLTRIRFRNIRINSRLPDRLFSFKPPRGVEIHKVP